MNKTKRRFGERIRRGLIALVLALGLTVGAGVFGATPASAEPGYYVLYYAWPTDVCSHQGNMGVTTLNPLDPYSLRCYDLSFPVPSFSLGGDLDIQGYCNWKYPGSVATLVEHDIFGWRCERKEKP
jgi:hypothetical protein